MKTFSPLCYPLWNKFVHVIPAPWIVLIIIFWIHSHLRLSVLESKVLVGSRTSQILTQGCCLIQFQYFFYLNFFHRSSANSFEVVQCVLEWVTRRDPFVHPSISCIRILDLLQEVKTMSCHCSSISENCATFLFHNCFCPNQHTITNQHTLFLVWIVKEWK